ncbi:MAG: chorismate lyase [Pseudomonadota bacterium]|nr:chorismate lyase [Pseudomonadota bacterium]
MPNRSLWHVPTRLLYGHADLIWPWLIAQGSLTQQLRQQAGGQFWVQPLRERLERPIHDESLFLKVPHTEWAWVREVYLFGADAEPWVHARSVIPISSLQGQARRLRYLGSRSLGSLLFARQTPACVREVAQLPDGWARRSRYLWHNQPLLVQECFLPAFIAHLERA